MSTPSPFLWVSLALGVGLIGVCVYAFYCYTNLTDQISATRIDLAAAQVKIGTLEADLSVANDDKRALSEALENEKNKNQVFEDQISDISSTVGYLAKLQATDPELLKKYSRVYFLNEHYAPKKLALIGKEWLYNPDANLEIHGDVQPRLHDLLADAKEDGLSLKVISAFRSFGTQAALKSHYHVVYGSGANQFSADQGYSEHQLGTTVDFTTPTVGASFTGFEKTPEYEWLKDNAHKYGFILSYPPNNKYYQYEPWHWRFVGEALARSLYKEGKYFYDLDQREIDTYLGEIFE